ncbi:hypothetical protein C1X59_21635 [Pseudomonas sp. FW215-R2]|jgi:hypothetical protein|uniref:hypothetical protein n=1 Tax=unclassified Pseudomonas TaxID=196821 RepID=UPI000C88946E|nr:MULTISPECIES: hypothetical protein [unclassified Pseudomonas]PMW97758.1 hypothetical protein C1X59_21635 [Pseudomonas sp. FW215-R2]PMX07179.1 hypothetical protein C1X60_21875 [Pseudomonas sp. FW215-L1]PMX21220.1 hypothetical protein C1X57_18730 [Pseudomonas sp. FW215-E1]PNA28042.1 hypothetical protein C1X58_18090 [Pseudomonas sp. FW215-R4]
MNKPKLPNYKFPSEEQGAFDPVPTHPEPNSPAHTVRHPEEERKIADLPEDEDPEKFDRSNN